MAYGRGGLMPWAIFLDWRFWAGAAFVALGVFAAVQTGRLDHEKAAFAQFRADTESLAAAAKVKNAQIEIDNLKRKEAADHENSDALANLAATIKRLRDSNSGRNIVPAAPAASKCPDGQACFGRSELERALRDYRSEIRELVDEGSEVVIDLNTAKAWAHP